MRVNVYIECIHISGNVLVLAQMRSHLGHCNEDKIGISRVALVVLCNYVLRTQIVACFYGLEWPGGV